MKLFSRVQLFATPWTAAYQAPPSMGFSRHEYWSGVPLPSPNKWMLTEYPHYVNGILLCSKICNQKTTQSIRIQPNEISFLSHAFLSSIFRVGWSGSQQLYTFSSLIVPSSFPKLCLTSTYIGFYSIFFPIILLLVFNVTHSDSAK